ncbi:MAG: MBL fold metallo-hydrolase [Thermotogae bacterium]|nr:MAG: MBL fold metallo-hydrolase [Thermotogota bacterium]
MLKFIGGDDDLKIYLHVSDLFGENSWFVVLKPFLFVVDPGRGSKAAMEELKEIVNVESVELVLTHGHVDHVYDLIALQPDKVYLHQSEKQVLLEPSYSLFDQFGINTACFAQIHFSDPSELGKAWKVIHTPGHTPGSCSYLLRDDYLFTGDTVFADSIGRTDLPGGDWQAMASSVARLTKLFREKPDLLILPGHGPITTAKYILQENPFFIR